MKKMILTVVAAMSMTFGYAETESKQAVDNANRYELTFDMRRLATKLDLTDFQMEAVKTIHDNLNEDFATAANTHGMRQWRLFDKAIQKDIRHMRQVLNDKQFETYMVLFGTTLHNRVIR